MKKSKNKYILRITKNGDTAIFHKTGFQVTCWWHNIIFENPLKYYIAIRKDGMKGLFHVDNPYKPISGWHKNIDAYGVIIGKSEYYLVENIKTNEQAIFNIKKLSKPISKWWNKINDLGILMGENEYYLAVRNDGKQTIFHISDPENPVVNWKKKILDSEIKKIIKKRIDIEDEVINIEFSFEF